MSRLIRHRITQLGDPVLRQKARPLNPPPSLALDKLIADMIRTMKAANGVGIAAPQVGRSEQLFIIASRPSPRYPHAPKMKPCVMMNPKLLRHSKTRVTDWEGCLSIPGIRAKVPRYRWVKVKYTDPKGKLRTVHFTSFVARIFQHELDHLNGFVFLDRARDHKTFTTETEYRKLLKVSKI